MKCICSYREFCKDISLPSIKNNVSEVAIKNKKEVLRHLKTGETGIVAPALMRDLFTGEPLNFELCIYSDGIYTWTSEEAYYFEKYNLKLNEDFLKSIL